MGDAAAVATEYLVSQLSQFASHHIKLIKEARGEAARLTDDLNYFNSFLRCASSKKIKDDTVKETLKQIRYTVYDAEDTVDTFVTQSMASKAKNWFRKLFSDPVRLDRIAQKVQEIRIEIEKKHGDKSKLDDLLKDLDDGIDDRPLVSPLKEKHVVGLDEDTKKIIGYLKEETPQLDIISIVGMPGLGKSTLAGKIFQDPEIQYEFPTRLWIYVSKFTPKDVFISILREFTTVTDDMHRMNELELAAKVKGHLDGGKFLIVMDDVWSPKDWEKVSIALPGNSRLGKVIITSRFVHVATAANSKRNPYKMDLLDIKDSIKLLQYEVFGEPKWEPSNIEPHGKIIAGECDGLPLAIVVIGGIILKKVSVITDNAAKEAAWKKFSDRVREHLAEDPDRMMDRVISLSYRKLPYHLKACFLYFAMFPEDIEIPTWKLFRMWIAEGLIQERKGFSLEETAESYLDELISRNLVIAGLKNSTGNIKTCRIHDSLREFCKTQAGHENECFLEEIKMLGDGILPSSLSDDSSNRRLCVHSDVFQFVSSKPYGKRVRSFVCFSKEELALPAEYISVIPAGFKLLRVLDAKPIRLPKIPADMYDLLHLRYIHLSFELAMLPKAFSGLLNMQTLIVDTTSRVLDIKADIWKMRQLRSIKTKATITLLQPENNSAKDENSMQTLGTISTESCTGIVLDRARSLKRLSIRGKLDMLLNSGNLARLSKLEKLKLINNVFPRPASEGKIPYLPSSQAFPPNLKILTLMDTYLDWGQMTVLATLVNLEVLKLKENAFVGNHWKVDDGGFGQLKVLFIGRTNLVVWKMSEDNFSNLMHLELQNCEELQEVPIEFAEKPSLDVLIVKYCRSAAASAKIIQDTKMKKLGDEAKDFKLTIFPPIK